MRRGGGRPSGGAGGRSPGCAGSPAPEPPAWALGWEHSGLRGGLQPGWCSPARVAARPSPLGEGRAGVVPLRCHKRVLEGTRLGPVPLSVPGHLSGHRPPAGARRLRAGPESDAPSCPAGDVSHGAPGAGRPQEEGGWREVPAGGHGPAPGPPVETVHFLFFQKKKK